MSFKHPVLLSLISLISGCYFALLQPAHIPLWLLVFLFLSLVVCLYAKRHLLFIALLMLFWFAWGFSAVSAELHNSRSVFVGRSVQQSPQVVFEGRIVSRPIALPQGHRFELQLEHILTERDVFSLQSKVLVTVASGQADWITGDRVRVRGSLRYPQMLGLPGEFNYPRYLSLKGIEFVAWVTDSKQVVVMRSAATAGLQRYLDMFARSCDQLLRQTLPDPAVHSVLMALITGSQQAIPPTLATAYARAGVSHILSISGFHVAIVSSMFVLLVSFAGLRWEWLAVRWNIRRTALLSSLPVMALYLFFTGGAPATVRSVVMLCAVVLALWVEREHEVLDALVSAAFLILLVTPTVVFDLSFQLSFLSLWGIIVLTPLLLPSGMHHMHGWLQTVITGGAASVAAVVSTAIPTLAAFHQASLTGVLANFVVVPLLGYGAVLLGAAAVPLVSLAPSVAAGLFTWAGILVQLANRFILWIAEFPVMRTYQVGVVDMLLMVAVLLALSFVPKRTVKMIVVCGLFITALVFHLWPTAVVHDRLQLTFLSVGQAESTLIRFPDNSTMLVDGGGYLHDTGRDFGERYLVPALHRLGVTRIDRMVLTHPHPDHSGGLPAVAEQFPIGEFWQGEGADQSADYLRLKQALVRSGVPIISFKGNRHVQIGDAVVQIWSSGADNQNVHDGNEQSLLLNVRYKQFSALLMADAGLQSEDWLLGQGPVAATLLKVGHHGSKSATGERFLNAVKPRLALISAGRDNRFGLPKREVLDRLASHGIELYRTDLDGTVQVESNGTGYLVRRNIAGH